MITDEVQRLIDDLGRDKAAAALAICEELGSNAEGLEAIAADILGKDRENPAQAKAAARNFYVWRMRSESLSRIYARAMASRAHVLAHTTQAMIDAEENPLKAKVKYDANRWLAAKFNRSEYGDDPPPPGGSDPGAEAKAGEAEELRKAIQTKLLKRAAKAKPVDAQVIDVRAQRVKEAIEAQKQE